MSSSEADQQQDNIFDGADVSTAHEVFRTIATLGDPGETR